MRKETKVLVPELVDEAAGPQAGSDARERNAMLRFTLITGAWFVGLFGLMRLRWVEQTLLTPFAGVQQRVADQLTGAPSDLVYADASCSGGDPLALCAGAIFAFPATWGARLRGAAVGFTVITAVNVVRLGHLSLIAENRTLLDLLHVYIWPAILILVAAGFVYAWMGRQGFDLGGGPGGTAGGGTGAAAGAFVLGAAPRRFLLLAALLVAAYFATAPFFYESAGVDVIAGWIAVTGGAIMTAAGTAATVEGPVIRNVHGAFIVTQECIFTPLIPLYLAAALAAPLGWGRRTAMLLATPAVFFALGVSRLLVLAVPAAVVGSYAVAIHAFSQILVAVILVAVAAYRTTGGGRRAVARGSRGGGAGGGGGVRVGAGPGRGGRRRGGGPADARGARGARVRGQPGGVGDPAGVPGGAVRGAVDCGGGRRPVVAVRAGRPGRHRPGAGRVRVAGGRAGPPLRLRPARGSAARLGAGAPGGGRLVAHPSGAVHRHRRSCPARALPAGSPPGLTT